MVVSAVCWLSEVGARGVVVWGGVSRVVGSFVCAGCLGPGAGGGRAVAAVGASADLEYCS